MPQYLEDVFHNDPAAEVAAWSDKLSAWLADAALPLWWENGADRVNGGFHEKLRPDGKSATAPRRAHVQARQSIAYALAGNLGWSGPWRDAARHGLRYLNAHYRRGDGLFCKQVSPSGDVLNDAAPLYDQGFTLFAAAAVHQALPDHGELKHFAYDLTGRIESALHHKTGGYKECGKHPFQPKSHMPLMAAALLWRELDDAPLWNRLADGIAKLCLAHFLDPDTMLIYELYDRDWKVLADGSEKTIVPGHHFAWSQLIERWARVRGDEEAHVMALRMFEVGAQGVESERGVTLDRYGSDFNSVGGGASLWAQAERLTAALTFADADDENFRQFYFDNAISAMQALWPYLNARKRGLWHETMGEDGHFVEGDADAASLYHIVKSARALRDAVEKR
jgi:mannose/cellobiose epimerase-like protein (N-acyl-D-glucosamine 2-epimerase family)